MINLPCYFGTTTDQPPSGYVQFSAEWFALDGVEMVISLYQEEEGNLVIASKTKDVPHDDDLVIVFNTVNRTPYRYMLTFRRLISLEQQKHIIGFLQGFWHPFGGLVSRANIEEQP